MSIVQEPTLVIRLYERMGKKRQLLLIVRICDILKLLATLLIPRKLEFALAFVFQKEPAISPAPFGDFDPDPRPIVIEPHSLIDGYLDLTHRILDIQYAISGRNQQFCGVEIPRCSSTGEGEFRKALRISRMEKCW